MSERTCRTCGCTDANACLVNGIPCHWVSPEECSACTPGLVAAGGWRAPAEIMYDVDALTPITEIISNNEISVRRVGISYDADAPPRPRWRNHDLHETGPTLYAVHESVDGGWYVQTIAICTDEATARLAAENHANTTLTWEQDDDEPWSSTDGRYTIVETKALTS